MLEMGLIVGLGLITTLVKAPPKIKLKLLSHPAKVDVLVTAMLLTLHWGTFSGVMVATIGAFVASIVLSIGRRYYGYYKTIQKNNRDVQVYVPGLVRLA